MEALPKNLSETISSLTLNLAADIDNLLTQCFLAISTQNTLLVKHIIKKEKEISNVFLLLQEHYVNISNLQISTEQSKELLLYMQVSLSLMQITFCIEKMCSHVSVLQDKIVEPYVKHISAISSMFSLMMKSAIDALIQNDSAIAQKSNEFSSLLQSEQKKLNLIATQLLSDSNLPQESITIIFSIIILIQKVETYIVSINHHIILFEK